MVRADAITLLELIETVGKKGCRIGHGKIFSGVDTRLVHRSIVEKLLNQIIMQKILEPR